MDIQKSMSEYWLIIIHINPIMNWISGNTISDLIRSKYNTDTYWLNDKINDLGARVLILPMKSFKFDSFNLHFLNYIQIVLLLDLT